MQAVNIVPKCKPGEWTTSKDHYHYQGILLSNFLVFGNKAEQKITQHDNKIFTSSELTNSKEAKPL